MKKITLLLFVLLFVGYSCDQDLLQETDSTAEKHKKKKDDCECDKEVGITQLSLMYIGDEPNGTSILVKTEKPKHFGHDHNKKKDDKKFKKAVEVLSVTVGEDINIVTGFEVTIQNTTAILERLGNKTWIQVGDKKPFEIHTSCSQPIGPGVKLGDFEVISAMSGDVPLTCEIETPPDYGDCGPCEGGGLSSLTLEYKGSGTSVTVKSKEKKNEVPYEETFDVSSEKTFTVFSGDFAEKIGGSNEIILTDNSGSQTIHISCSQPIDVGLVFGNYTIVDGHGAKTGPFCPEEDCISDFDKWIPDTQVQIIVTDPNPIASANSYFNLEVSGAGQIDGSYKAYCIDYDTSITRGSLLNAFVYSSYENLLPEVRSRLRNPDTFDQLNYLINNFKVGDPVPLTSYPGCAPTGGQNENLTSGDIQQAMWYILEGRMADAGYVGSLGDRNPLRVNYIICETENKGVGFKPDCGDDIGVIFVPEGETQIVFGVFDCIDECEEEENCGPCDGGGISSLTLEYKGNADSITVKSKPKGKDASSFVQTYDVSSNKTFTVFSGELSQKIGGSNEIILNDGNGDQNIHISCSQPIDIGLEFGKYKIVDGYGVKTGPFCKD